MNKQMMLRVLFFVLSCGVFGTQHAAGIQDFRDDFYAKDPWGFIGREFYKKPKEEYNRWWKKAVRFIALSAGTIGATAGSGYAFKKAVDADLCGLKSFFSEKWKKASGIVGASTVGGTAFVGTYFLMNAYLRKKADKMAVKRFLENWEYNKTYTPDGLQPVFTKLVMVMKRDGWNAISKDAIEIVQEIRKQLIRHDKEYAALAEQDRKTLFEKYFRFALTLNVKDIVGLSVLAFGSISTLLYKFVL
jgi:hypothetical protein